MRHLPLIQLLAQKEDNQLWNYILENLTTEQVTLLQDIVRNVLRGNIPLANHKKEELFKKRNILRTFGKERCLKKKRVQIKQIGRGIFSILIPALASLVGGLISR